MEIAPGVHSLGQRRGGRVHAFLLDDGHDLTVIDTLFDTDGGRVLSAISRLGYTPRDLKQIVLTHGHRSHLGGLAALKRLTGATIYAHGWEADIIAGERKAQPVTWRPVRPVRTWWPTYPFQLGINLGFGKHPACPIDRAVADGDAIGPLQVDAHAGTLARAPRVLLAGAARALCRRRNRNLAHSGSGLARVQSQPDPASRLT